jgi:hypothetical protein
MPTRDHPPPSGRDAIGMVKVERGDGRASGGGDADNQGAVRTPDEVVAPPLRPGIEQCNAVAGELVECRNAIRLAAVT